MQCSMEGANCKLNPGPPALRHIATLHGLTSFGYTMPAQSPAAAPILNPPRPRPRQRGHAMWDAQAVV